MPVLRRPVRWVLLTCLIAAAIGLDLGLNGIPQTFVVSTLDSQTSGDEPLQVEGLPLLRPGTLTLGEGHPVVAVAASDDRDLAAPAPLDAPLDYAQVDAIVRRALDLDRSPRSLRAVIESGDHVLIKVNSVSNRGDLGSQGDCCSRYTHDGSEHPGQITDLRVVKSVVDYLLDHTSPASITIAEGGSGSPRRDKPGFPSYATEDSWSVTYPEFADLSYLRIVDEANARGTATVVDTSDLNYAPYRREPVPGGPVSRLGVTRSTWPGAQYGFHVDGSGSFRTDGFYVPEIVLDADKMISIPAMKTTIFGATLGIKNYVGVLAPLAYGTGIGKGAHAANNPEQGYVDLFSYNPAVYTVIEGFWATEGNGPQRGDNVQHNVIVASGDPVAADAVGSYLMGFNPLDLEHLYLAAAKGFGTLDMRRMDLVGRPPITARRNFVKSQAVRAAEGRTMYYGRGIRRWLLAGPFPSMDVDFQPVMDEADLRPLPGEAVGGEGQWQRVEHLGYSAERLQISEIHGTGFDVQSLAFTLVDSWQEQEGYLWLGYDDVVKVILNGETIYTDKEPRGFHLGDVQIPLRLQQGENRLLLKVGNRAGRSTVAAHVADEDGDRLPGISFRLPGEIPTAIQDSDATLPAESSLVNLYPNPFNAQTRIRFRLSTEETVDLAVWDVLGRRVKELVATTLPAGEHEIGWDGRADDGSQVATGVYWVRLQTPGGGTSVRPLTLLR